MSTARSYADVEGILRGLGKPADGHRRVYRGQSQGYWDAAAGRPTITPALQRGKTRGYDPGWLVHMTHVLQGTQSSPAASATGVSPEFAMVWAPALIQHYGPGSYFVDVTFDPAVATWFALHQYHERWMSLQIGNDATVFSRWAPTAWYTPVVLGDRRPAIYVFDLPVWDGVISPGFGAIVDLLGSSLGEWIRQHSARLAVQQGALLHANPSLVEHGDVAALLTAAIELAEDFDRSSVPGNERSTRALFPAPADDPFYRLLIEQPAHIRFQPTRLEAPLAVPWYFSEEPSLWEVPGLTFNGGTGARTDPLLLSWSSPTDARPKALDELEGYVQATRWIDPPLVHGNVTGAAVADTMELDGERHAFADALPLMLESVFFLSAPPVTGDETSMWIESALPWGIAGVVDGRSTASVFIELSPLDYINAVTGSYGTVPRAMWLVHRHPFYVLRVYVQDDEKIRYVDMRFQFDAEAGAFVADQAVTKAHRKALYLGLVLLRDLSDGFKPAAKHSFGFGTTDASGARRTTHFPDGLLVPRRAVLKRIARGRYFVPTSEDGGPYAFGVRMERTWLPSDPAVARASLEMFFPRITDPSYVVYAARDLTSLQAEAGAWSGVVDTTNRGLAILEKSGLFLKDQLDLRLRKAAAQYRLGLHEAALATLDSLSERPADTGEPNAETGELIRKAAELYIAIRAAIAEGLASTGAA